MVFMMVSNQDLIHIFLADKLLDDFPHIGGASINQGVSQSIKNTGCVEFVRVFPDSEPFYVLEFKTFHSLEDSRTGDEGKCFTGTIQR